MSYQPHGRVENYTRPFLVTAWVFVFMTLWLIASLFGLLWVIAVSYACDLLLKWAGRRKQGK
ncbi:hypothetical protein [Yoonia sp.]|uniref:hypothetical protein n=1 Tax=Yoonia sp. TaxID=2212373 RepID=UPI0025D56E31|nr:hypothetical protein [Yoonia sp.]